MKQHPTTARTVQELREALKPARRAGKSIGLVPTMGALHDGHLSLIRRAREQTDFVVVSVFVNPTQFDRAEDLEQYPRQVTRDVDLALQAGADLVFIPSVAEVYPDGFTTSVQVAAIADGLEGAVRGPEHFRGVATVVTKLFNMVMPDIAYFGQKDAQQVAVIRRVVTDLDLTVQVEVCPTVREGDGLAMSSRNQRLSARQREQALALFAGLLAAANAFATGVRDTQTLEDVARDAMRPFGIEPDYIAAVAPEFFEPVTEVDQAALLVVAAQIGEVRLIDNLALDPAPPTPDRATAASVVPQKVSV